MKNIHLSVLGSNSFLDILNELEFNNILNSNSQSSIYINIPPHTWIVCPVMYPDISDARNTVRLATSNGEPPLFSGIESLHS